MQFDFLSHFTTLESRKSELQRTMEIVNDFFAPSDKAYRGHGTISNSDFSSYGQGELYDTTGTDLLEEYVTYVLGLFFDHNRTWFSIAHEDFASDDDVTNILQQRAEKLFKLIGKTNYYQECTQHDWDVLVHGHGLLVINPDTDNFARVRCKNPINVYLNDDEMGMVKEVYWEEYYTGIELSQKFGEEVIESLKTQNVDIDKTSSFSESHRVITCFVPIEYPFFDKEEVKKFPRGHKFAQRYFIDVQNFSALDDKIPKTTHVGVDSFESFKEKRVFPVRDAPTRRHPYGKGYGKRLLPRARIQNNLMATLIRMAKLQADPPKLVSPEIAQAAKMYASGTGNKRPGYTLFPIEAGSTFIADVDAQAGTKPVELFPVAGDISHLFNIFTVQREQYAEMLPVAGSVYKVARQSIDEIQQRTEQQQKRLAPLRANYTQEGLSQHLQFFYELAKKRGHFRDLPFPEDKKVNEKKIKFIFDTFLLQINRLSDSLRMAQTLSTIGNFLAIKPTMADYLNGDRIVKDAFSSNGVFKYLHTDNIVAEIRKQAQQQVQQQQDAQTSALDAQTLKAGADVVNSLGSLTPEG